MKKLYIFCLAILLVGCEDTANLSKPSDKKDYFLCTDNAIESYQSVLVIDSSQRQIDFDFIDYTWEGYTISESTIYAEYQGVGYDNALKFNFISGELRVTLSTYSEDDRLKEFNGVINYYFTCNKTESML